MLKKNLLHLASNAFCSASTTSIANVLPIAVIKANPKVLSLKNQRLFEQRRKFLKPTLEPHKLIKVESIIDSSDLEIDTNVKTNLDNLLSNLKQQLNAAAPPSPSSFSSLISGYFSGESNNGLIDPSKVVEQDINAIVSALPETVKSKDPTVSTLAKYFFSRPGKLFRPTVLLLVSRACFGSAEVDMEVIKKQRKLAEVTEMIHVASLVHDDIIDEADTRRGIAALHKIVGNHIAVQAGDYLLARACYELAHLENHEVSKCFARSIEHLATGEISQASNKGVMSFERYVNSIFFKTASLIAHSCKCAALLANTSTEKLNAAYTYGKHLGLAYQLIDDILDFTQSAADIGKPSHGADMKAGIATAPVLFAAQQYPQLQAIIERKFSEPSDIETTFKLVAEYKGIEKTQQLALTHCKKAIEAALAFEPSDARTGLISLVEIARNRKK